MPYSSRDIQARGNTVIAKSHEDRVVSELNWLEVLHCDREVLHACKVRPRQTTPQAFNSANPDLPLACELLDMKRRRLVRNRDHVLTREQRFTRDQRLDLVIDLLALVGAQRGNKACGAHSVQDHVIG